MTEDLAASAQPLLKREWERVKAGEETYRRAKRWATIVSWALAGVIAVLILGGTSFFLGEVFCRLKSCGH